VIQDGQHSELPEAADHVEDVATLGSIIKFVALGNLGVETGRPDGSKSRQRPSEEDVLSDSLQ